MAAIRPDTSHTVTVQHSHRNNGSQCRDAKLRSRRDASDVCAVTVAVIRWQAPVYTVIARSNPAAKVDVEGVDARVHDIKPRSCSGALW